MSDDSADGRERTLTRRAGVVGAGVLTSRVFGLVRDAVIAASFSVGLTDAFFVAFTIPNALRSLLGEGAVSGAFVPVFAEVETKEGATAARTYLATMFGVLAAILAVVSVLGILFAPQLVALYAGGYDAERERLTVNLTRIVFPYIFFMGLAALAAGVLNVRRRFFAPAFAPVLLNLAMIAGVLVAIPSVLAMGWPAIAVLAVAALVGGVLQLAVLLPTLQREGFLPLPRFSLSNPYVQKSLGLMVPLLAGMGVYQINILLSRRFASFLSEGSQSYLYYAQRMVELPQGLFAFALATATLPTLSALRAKEDLERVRETFGFGLRTALFVAIPSSVALAALADPLVS
ncbi:MAG: murein biosynthesis integral membrane protein MurJ, partial [Myxococcales bacterium]|nr:murein biosynthesis integral membrane protein MurJ [Myxococcales bacterium]